MTVSHPVGNPEYRFSRVGAHLYIIIVFSSGASNVANIFEHMSRSRTVLVVLTRHYYNGMNEFELDQATAMLHEHKLSDIIVIEVGNVPTGRVPPHLYAKMRSGAFIEWGEEEDAVTVFREKLKDSLRGNSDPLNLL